MREYIFRDPNVHKYRVRVRNVGISQNNGGLFLRVRTRSKLCASLAESRLDHGRYWSGHGRGRIKSGGYDWLAEKQSEMSEEEYFDSWGPGNYQDKLLVSCSGPAGRPKDDSGPVARVITQVIMTMAWAYFQSSIQRLKFKGTQGSAINVRKAYERRIKGLTPIIRASL